MSGVALCRYKGCPKADTCLRYENKEQGDTYIDFQQICPSKEYQWYWKKEIQLATVDENNN